MTQKNNQTVKKFKNQFNIDPKFHQLMSKKDNQNIQGILSDKMTDVIQQKIQLLLVIFKKNSFQKGYQFQIAYRVIILYLFSQVETSSLNLFQEVNRFIEKTIQSQQFSNIQKAMDILLIKQLVFKLPDRQIKLWKVLVLQALKKYYKSKHLKQQKSKVVKSIRSICVQTIQKQDVKKDIQTYTRFLDILIYEERHHMQSLIRRGKTFEAIQFGNNIIRALEKAEQSIISKYQQQLMNAYWDIAQLHHRLHYATYAKKYANIALNIAQRINDKKNVQLMKAMIQQLNL